MNNNTNNFQPPQQQYPQYAPPPPMQESLHQQHVHSHTLPNLPGGLNVNNQGGGGLNNQASFSTANGSDAITEMENNDDNQGRLYPARSIKRIAAVNSKFVVALPISRNILQEAQYTKETVTHEPEEFVSQAYNLRAAKLNRKVKIALVMTMYNEDEDLFTKSMINVQKNIAYLCDVKRWGPDGWKNFVVVIVSDGRKKINPKVLTVLNVMGCYADGLVRSSVDGRPVKAHLFECTTQIGVDRVDLAVVHRKGNYHLPGIFPTQVIFLLKENNAKKINSHKWFFEAICETIKPEVTMLLDVGTKPRSDAFWHLYRAFERNPNLGGACGEIIAEIGKWGSKLWNPYVASQNFEYKMSNILDKPLESVCGYITVLPGAFSAYRFEALKGRPLDCYFAGENPLADIFTSNLYLAEDRILCFEVAMKKDHPWTLKYIKAARAETDVPDTLPELTSQRRRWLNGSFFASIHALYHFSQIYSSPHSRTQKFIFTLEFAYHAFNLYFSWLSLANFYLSFYFLFDVRKSAVAGNSLTPVDTVADPFFPNGEVFFDCFQGIYICAITAMFITALGNRPQGTPWLYYLISGLFSIIMILMIFMGIWTIVLQVSLFNTQTTSFSNAFAYVLTTPAFRDLVVSVVSTYGLYLFASLLHMDAWHILNSMVQYLLILPTYNNIFMIYSFCNLHDVTWGTKGDNKVAEDINPVLSKKQADGHKEFEVAYQFELEDIDKEWSQKQKLLRSYLTAEPVEAATPDEKTMKEDSTKIFRTKIVLFWIFSNLLLIGFFTNTYTITYLFPRTIGSVNPYLTFLFWSVAFISLIRAMGTCVYLYQVHKENRLDALSISRGNVVGDLKDRTVVTLT